MRQTVAARTPTRTTLRATGVGLAVAALFIGTLAYRPASPAAPSLPDAGVRSADLAVPQAPPSLAVPRGDVPRGDRGRATTAEGGVTEDDGALPGGVTVFDEAYPGVANLDRDLLQALREAARDAADAGVELYVNSGWRSPEFQRQLIRAAIAEYGSEEEAARWVASAETSPHVSGDAVDIGSDNATAWLREHGAEYGLCQIYRNEPWHYELRPAAIERGCPRMFADSSHDPRLQD